MNKKIIIIEGYMASGKSTFALELSRKLSLPYLMKDTFKTALCQSFFLTSREESKKFSAIAFDGMMYAVERLFEVGLPVIIEANFVPYGSKKVDEEKIIKNLIEKYGYTSLTFKFFGNTEVLLRRFTEREGSAERGQANRMGFIPTLKEFESLCHNLDAFNVGGDVVKINTTNFDKVDFNSHYKTAEKFLNKD